MSRSTVVNYVKALGLQQDVDARRARGRVSGGGYYNKPGYESLPIPEERR
jgi:hypothetical protein